MALARVRSMLVLLVVLASLGVLYSISLTEYVTHVRLKKSLLHDRIIAAHFGQVIRGTRLRLTAEAELPEETGPVRHADDSYAFNTTTEAEEGVRFATTTSLGDAGVLFVNRTRESSARVSDFSPEVEDNGERINSNKSNTETKGIYHLETIRQENVSSPVDVNGTSPDPGLVFARTPERKEQLPDPGSNRTTAQVVDPGNAALRCPDLRKPVVLLRNGSTVSLKTPEEGTWQTVLDQVVYVFSAHRDPRVPDRNRVRVFGITLKVILPDPVKSRFYCQLWTPRTLVLIVAAAARAIGYRHRYESFVLDCDFPRDLKIKPTHFVSVTKFPCINSYNALRIHGRPSSGSYRHRYAVCLLGSIQAKSYGRFVEWLELNAILGAELITVYVSDRSPAARRLLMYGGQVVLDRVTWSAPTYGAAQAIRTTLVNDCLYRSAARARYLVMLAVNETLAPGATWLRSWDDMIREAGCANSSLVIAPVAFLDTVERVEDGLSGRIRSSSGSSPSRQLIQTPEDAIKGILRPEVVDVIGDYRIRFLDGVRVNPCIIPDHIGKLYRFS